MEIPIYIDGRRTGTMRMEKCGAYTVLHGDMEDVGRLVRLYVFGEREMYLGVPEPEEGRLVLLRRLTAGEMRKFPRHPEYVAEHRRKENKTEKKEEGKGDTFRHILWQGGKPYFF